MGITDALDRIQEDEPPFDDSEWESMNENNSGIFVMVSGTTSHCSENVSSWYLGRLPRRWFTFGQKFRDLVHE